MKKNPMKNNINYFRMSDSGRLIGGALLVLGLLSLWLRISWIATVIFVPVGLALFLYTSIVRAGDADIDAEIAKRMEELEFHPEEDPDLSRKVIKNQEPFLAEGYVLREGLMLRRDKTSRLRSSEYSRAILHLLSDRLCIQHRVVSLVEDRTVTHSYQIPYASLQGVSILRSQETLTFNKKSFPTSVTLFQLTSSEGSITFPINDDVEADHLVERIEKLKEANGK